MYDNFNPKIPGFRDSEKIPGFGIPGLESLIMHLSIKKGCLNFLLFKKIVMSLCLI
jgi:hypothetical protein